MNVEEKLTREEYAQAELIESAPVGRFACEAPSWAKAKPVVCYLTEQYRQDDSDFLTILSSVRKNTFGENHLRHIEKRKIKHSDAPVGVPKLFRTILMWIGLTKKRLLKFQARRKNLKCLRADIPDLSPRFKKDVCRRKR